MLEELEIWAKLHKGFWGDKGAWDRGFLGQELFPC